MKRYKDCSVRVVPAPTPLAPDVQAAIDAVMTDAPPLALPLEHGARRFADGIEQ